MSVLTIIVLIITLLTILHSLKHFERYKLKPLFSFQVCSPFSSNSHLPWPPRRSVVKKTKIQLNPHNFQLSLMYVNGIFSSGYVRRQKCFERNIVISEKDVMDKNISLHSVRKLNDAPGSIFGPLSRNRTDTYYYINISRFFDKNKKHKTAGTLKNKKRKH